MTKTTLTQQSKTSTFLPPNQGMLQRKCACGNHTVAGGECAECAKKKSVLQRKLAIGASNDPLEQEANRVADQVMAAPAHSAVNSAPLHIQRYAGQAAEGADTPPASVDHVLASSGRPLEPALRQDMEHRFGYDFSKVRVHTGATAEQSAREVNANAYTVGQDIVFGPGQFAPDTHQGRRLFVHELTHVVQQREAYERSGSLGLKGSNFFKFQRQPSTSERKEQKREDFLKDLVKWPENAHQQWKRLGLNDQNRVVVLMSKRYGEGFAKEFLRYTKSGSRIETHITGGAPPHSPQWFYRHGYQLAQRDIQNEWWVHPSGSSIAQPLRLTKDTHSEQEDTLSMTENPQELLDMALEAVRGSIKDSNKMEKGIMEQKQILKMKRYRGGDEFEQLYDEYLGSLDELGELVDKQLEDSEDWRRTLEEVSPTDVAKFDAEVLELRSISIWVNYESDPKQLQWLEPFNLDPKVESPDESEDEEE